MGYTPVPTKATGDSWSAKDMNRYVRDNFAAGIPDLFTTKGDLAVGTGVDAALRLAVGANFSYLRAYSVAASGLAWLDGFNARYQMTGTQSGVATNTDTIINYAGEDYDSVDAVTTGTSWKFTAPVTGYYLVRAGYHMDQCTATVGNSAMVRLFKEGALYSTMGRRTIQAAITLSSVDIIGEDIIYLVAAEYIDIRVRQGIHQSNPGAIYDGYASFVTISRL